MNSIYTPHMCIYTVKPVLVVTSMQPTCLNPFPPIDASRRFFCVPLVDAYRRLFRVPLTDAIGRFL